MGLPAGFSSFIYTPSSPVTAVSQSNASLVKCRFNFFLEKSQSFGGISCSFSNKKKYQWPLKFELVENFNQIWRKRRALASEEQEAA